MILCIYSAQKAQKTQNVQKRRRKDRKTQNDRRKTQKDEDRACLRRPPARSDRVRGYMGTRILAFRYPCIRVHIASLYDCIQLYHTLRIVLCLECVACIVSCLVCFTRLFSRLQGFFVRHGILALFGLPCLVSRFLACYGYMLSYQAVFRLLSCFQLSKYNLQLVLVKACNALFFALQAFANIN